MLVKKLSVLVQRAKLLNVEPFHPISHPRLTPVRVPSPLGGLSVPTDPAKCLDRIRSFFNRFLKKQRPKPAVAPTSIEEPIPRKNATGGTISLSAYLNLTSPLQFSCFDALQRHFLPASQTNKRAVNTLRALL